MRIRSRNAWLLSLGIHLLLVGILSLWYARSPSGSVEEVWHVSFISTSRHRPPLRLPAVSPSSSPSAFGSLVPLASIRIPSLILPHHHLESPAVLRLPDGTPGMLEASDAPPVSPSSPGDRQPQPRFLSQRKPTRWTSRVPAPHRPSLPPVSPPTDDLVLPDNPLEVVSNHILDSHASDRIDLVLLVDASQSMEDNIRAVARYLEGMVRRLSAGSLDLQIALVTFRHSGFIALLGWDLEVLPLTRDVDRIQRRLETIECIGGERALDALVQTIDRIQFRQGSERRILLVTDEYVSGKVSGMEVLRKLHQARVHVDVIGRDEPFQRLLARRTGGLWQSIAELDR